MHNKDSFLDRARDTLARLDLKTILYTIGVLAIIILILITAKGTSKYGSVSKEDGKFYLDLAKISRSYGLNLNNSEANDDSNASDQDQNITNDLGKSLIITTLYLDQNGLTDPNVKGKILANIILDYQKRAQGKTYAESDLSVIRNTDQKSMQDYFESIDKTFTDYETNLKNLNLLNVNTSSSTSENQFDQSVVSLKGGISANILRTLDLNNDLVSKLLSIPATSAGVQYQLELINLIASENAYLESLAYIDTDPMKYLLLEGDTFQDTFSKNLENTLNSFRSYFKNNGVQFSN